MDVRVLLLGEAAITLEAQACADPALALRMLAVARWTLDERDAGRLDGVTDVMPSFRSLTVCFDPLRTDRDRLAARLAERVADDTVKSVAGRSWRVPACYDPRVAGDLEELAKTLGIGIDELVGMHSEGTYDVLVIGFLPGFPYLGPLPERLRLPRRATPHLRVPAGSVAVANQYTSIYPWESPGGWHLIGRTPLPLFDPVADPPSTLLAGDRVRFEPIAFDDYRELHAQAAAGTLDLAGFVTERDA
jgi:KipI family sensor histidine kinase inhibitor